MKTNKRSFIMLPFDKRNSPKPISQLLFFVKEIFFVRALPQKFALLWRKQSQQNIWVSEERSIFVWKRQKLRFDLIPIIVNKQKTQLLKKYLCCEVKRNKRPFHKRNYPEPKLRLRTFLFVVTNISYLWTKRTSKQWH